MNFVALQATVQAMDAMKLLAAWRAPAAAILLALPLTTCSSATDPVTTVWSGTLASVGASIITGTVGAVTQGGRTSATVQIRKGTPGETYGWRIDSGSCGGSGQIQGGTALYPGLTADPSGSASADAGLSAILTQGSSYAARVFRGSGAGEEIVACGELEESR